MAYVFETSFGNNFKKNKPSGIVYIFPIIFCNLSLRGTDDIKDKI